MADVPFKVRFGLNANKNRIINVDDPAEWDDATSAMDATPRDWILDRANWTDLAARVSDLPLDTAAAPIRDGQTHLIKYRFGGTELSRLAVWDSTKTRVGGIKAIKTVVPAAEVANVIAEAALGSGWPGEVFTGGNKDAVFDITPNADGTVTTTITTPGSGYGFGESYKGTGYGSITKLDFDVIELAGASATGGWRFINFESWIKATQAGGDVLTDRVEGDYQATTENLHKELKIFTNGAWVTLFSEDNIKAWIASLSLFEGTVEEEGGGAVGAQPFDNLPDLANETRLKNLGQVSHYWTFVGSPNTEAFAEYDAVGLTAGVPGTYSVTADDGTWLVVRVLTPTTAKVGVQLLFSGTVNGDTLTIAAGDLGAGSGAATVVIPDILKLATPIIGEDLNGALLNPGDWVQISNRGTVAAPDLRWVTIGGDLLAKARADKLFSLGQWVDGGWEKGSLVTDKGTVYRAKQGVIAGDSRPGVGLAKAQVVVVTIAAPTGVGEAYTLDVNGNPATYTTLAGDGVDEVRVGLIAAINLVNPILLLATPAAGAKPEELSLTATTPGTAFVATMTTTNLTSAVKQVNVVGTTNPWEKVDISGGVRWVQTDGDLPANAPPGEIYFVLASSIAGGSGRLVYWDGGAAKWQDLGGGAGGTPMDLSDGYPIVNVGVPIGSVQMWVIDAPPPGWLKLDGSVFSAATYPELAQVLGNTTLPDFRGAFVRGAGLNGNGIWGDAARQVRSWQESATERPTAAFTGTTNNSGAHTHGMNTNRGATGWKGGGTNDYALVRQGGGDQTASGGIHTHSVSINGGGDSETRPKNYAVHYIIKAADIAQRVRI